MGSDVVLDLGWGRLVFGQTFDELGRIVDALRAEESGRRDICVYPRDPQVLVGLAPDELFIDPSLIYRLDLHRYRPRSELIRGVFVRTVTSAGEMAAINDLYAQNGMVLADAVTMWANHRTRGFTYLVAEDRRTGQIVGTITGVDHVLTFGDAVFPAPGLPGLEAEVEEIPLGAARFDLTVNVRERRATAGLDIAIDFAQDLYDEGTVRAFADRLARFLDQVAEHPDLRIGDVGLLSEQEQRRLVEADLSPRTAQSLPATTRMSCSTTTTVFPAAARPSSWRMSRSTSAGCRPVVGSSRM